MWATSRRSLAAVLLLLSLSPAAGLREESGQDASLSAEADAGSTLGASLQAGSMVFDRYELIARLESSAWPVSGVKGYAKVGYLGKGAFGETWLARDTSTDEQVAIKFFYRAGYNGQVQLLNMANANAHEKAELNAAGAECDVPKAIVKAKTTPEGANRFALCLKNNVKDRDYAHLVLEVAGSEDLDKFMEKHKSARSDHGLVMRLAKMLLEGLVQMEGHYVHRDIKPANLMTYEDGGKIFLKFIDFGLVVKEGVTDGLAGTPMFMPPELWPVVPRTTSFSSSFDVYSTGETLYWLICGFTFHEKIFQKVGGQGETELKRMLVSTDPAQFCKPAPALSGLFNLVVKKMLPASAGARAKASALLNDAMFQGVETSQTGEAAEPQQQVPSQGGAKPSPAGNGKPQPPRKSSRIIVKVESVEAPKEPTFLDKCHDNKQHWFANVAQCCLLEKYDAKREAVCQRPCGPKVAYEDGKCARNCQPTSSGQFEFSKTKFCCVATVWKDKCIYPELTSGEGWRWMAAEGV